LRGKKRVCRENDRVFRALRGGVLDDARRRPRVAHLVDLGNVVEAAKQQLIVHVSRQRFLSESQSLLQIVQPLAQGIARRFGALLRSRRVHG